LNKGSLLEVKASLQKPFMENDGTYKSLLKKLIFFFSISVLSFSCTQPGWVRKDNSVIIRLKPENSGSARLIRIEILRDDIIHVTASPVNSFSKEKSLCVIPTENISTGFSVRQIIDTLLIMTSRSQVKVSLTSGKIRYLDQDGRIRDLSRKINDESGFYIINGNDHDELIRAYRMVTGRAPIMPKWAIGCWRCHELSRYNGLMRDSGRMYTGNIFPRDSIVGLWAYDSDASPGKTWDDLKNKIKEAIDSSLSGIPYWTVNMDKISPEGSIPDKGRIIRDNEESGELFTRWYQFGSFCPLLYDTGQMSSYDYIKPGSANNRDLQSRLYYSKLRYSLIPYLYSLAGLTYFNDYTMMRAMVMDFGEDKKVTGISDQYMFGPSLLVAPVYKFKAVTREVYLPGICGWYDFHTGNYYSGGGMTEAQAPYDRIPLFVKEGSVIPAWTTENYPSNKSSDHLTFFIYSGRDCAFTLYEDEGVSYNYEKGECSTIKISYNDITNQITIGDRTGEFPGMLKSRIFNFILVSREDPVPFNPDAEPDISVGYEGRQITFETGKIK